jgi:hypothetical protein
VEKRKQLALAAEADHLDAFKYLDIIDKFAQRYGLHPDSVYSGTSFGTVTNFLAKWFREGEVSDRWNELERMMTATPTQQNGHPS